MRTLLCRKLFGVSLFCASLLGGLSGCYQVNEPVCAYACGVDQSCPRSYECRADRYCHRKGSTAACEYSDASVVMEDASIVDMSMPDQNQSFDLPPADGSAHD